MMKHCDGETPVGQAGAAIGVVVWPSSTSLAVAAPGARPSASSVIAAASSENRFMIIIQTRPGGVSCGHRRRPAGGMHNDSGPAAPVLLGEPPRWVIASRSWCCLLYTSDA